ncbi:transketolase family protein [Nanoarchaeota archaeon]
MSKSTRDAFGESLLEVGESNKKIVVVSCDLSGATRTKAFGKKFPDRFFEVGIAEQNGISVAAGLAMEGFRPFISSFGAFITGRYDQIRISCAYTKAPVVIVGTHAGLAIGKDGATQMGIEDINKMSGIPGMQIFQPADAIETKQIIEYLSKNNELAYLRLSRQPQETVHKPDYIFEFNKGKVLKEGKDLTIIATGDTVQSSLQSAEELAKKGIDLDVINISTLKPIDKELILEYAKKRPGIITVEDHSIIGGLGSRVCEIIAEAGLKTKVKRLGINDCFGESGKPEDLYRKHGLDKEGIIKSIKEFSENL